MASATTASALHHYTYALGRSLYVPVTSRCNAVPLPATRGPGFALPRRVAAALLRVRDAECHRGRGEGAAADAAGVDLDAWDLLEEHERVLYPAYTQPLVRGLYRHLGDDALSEQLQLRRKNHARAEAEAGGVGILDDFEQPSIKAIVGEVTSLLEEDGDQPRHKFNNVVIAGEGEPTLRMEALLAVARSVGPLRRPERPLPVRVTTNGLCYGVPNLGYSPFNNERSSALLPMHRHVVLRDLLEAGITQLSVALNTADRHEYDALMRPSCCLGGGEGGGEAGRDDRGRGGGGGGGPSADLLPGTAHDLVCEFVLEATALGLDVDVTGVLRPGIDRGATERLARLLRSGGPHYRRQRRVRWREFFE